MSLQRSQINVKKLQLTAALCNEIWRSNKFDFVIM